LKNKHQTHAGRRKQPRPASAIYYFDSVLQLRHISILPIRSSCHTDRCLRL